MKIKNRRRTTEFLRDRRAKYNWRRSNRYPQQPHRPESAVWEHIYTFLADVGCKTGVARSINFVSDDIEVSLECDRFA